MKILIDKRFVQIGGVEFDQVPAAIGLPICHRYRFDHRTDLFKEQGLADVQAVEFTKPALGEVVWPGKTRRCGNQFFNSHFVVGFLRVAHLQTAHRRFGKPCFDLKHGLA